MTLRIFILPLCLVAFVQGVFAEDAAIGSYKNYQENVSNYCKLEKTGLSNTERLWNDWKGGSLIRLDEVRYADVTNRSGDNDYKEYLKKIKSDPGKIDTFDIFSPTPNYLDKASYVYTETMGAIYSCAVLNAKLKITKNLLEIIPTDQSNIKRDLTRQTEVIRKRLDGGFCRDISSWKKELSVKKILLDNTMYQYCNYRYYLYYLDYNAKNSANTFFRDSKNGNGSSLLHNTDSAAQFIQRQNNLITNEISHVKEIFPQALVAYSEFERTYASHIALTFILQDYVALRDTLKKLINPIGQVIYNASWAQGKK